MHPRYSALVLVACGLPSCSHRSPLFDTTTARPKTVSGDDAAPEPLAFEPVTLPVEGDRHERVVRIFLAALSTGDRHTVRGLLATGATWSGPDGEAVRRSALAEVERFMMDTEGQTESDHRSPNSPQGVEIMDTKTSQGMVRVAAFVSRPDSLRGVWRFAFEQELSASPLIEEVTLPERH